MTEIYLDGCSKFSRIGHDDEESRTMSLNHLLEEVMQQSNHSYNINLASNNSVNTTQMISDLRCAMRFWKYFVSTVKISCRRDVDFIDKTALEVIQMCDEFVDRFSLSWGSPRFVLLFVSSIFCQPKQPPWNAILRNLSWLGEIFNIQYSRNIRWLTQRRYCCRGVLNFKMSLMNQHFVNKSRRSPVES